MADPKSLKYTVEHEWVQVDEPSAEGRPTATIGVSEWAVKRLGELLFLRLPEEGTVVDAVEAVGTLESDDVVADLHAPVSGPVVELNQAVLDDPTLVNRDPYGEGWLYRVRLGNAAALDSLLGYEDYVTLTG